MTKKEDSQNEKILFSIVLTFIFVSTLFLPITFAQDYQTWGLPDGAKARLGKGSINEIAYSPDGTWLAVASSIGIWIYDAHTGEPVASGVYFYTLKAGDFNATRKMLIRK